MPYDYRLEGFVQLVAITQRLESALQFGTNRQFGKRLDRTVPLYHLPGACC